MVEVRNLSIALENMREGIQRRDALVANLAYVDQLTLLPNRARLAELLQHHLLTPDSHGAVLMLNLDRFKRVNDVLGRELGDRLPQAVGKRLRELCSAVHAWWPGSMATSSSSCWSRSMRARPARRPLPSLKDF